MVKLKPLKSQKANLNKKIPKSKSNSEIKSFLKEIKTNINKIKSSKNKLYTLFSCIFLCFHENKKKILDKKEICDFVKKEINENYNKIITSNLKGKRTKQSELEFVTIRNYYPKLIYILNNNKCITKIFNIEANKEEKYELNKDYIMERKVKIINHLFRPKTFSKISPTPKKRNHMIFEFSVSSVKKEKIDEKEKTNDKKKEIKDKDIKDKDIQRNKDINKNKDKNIEKCEDDSFIISSKETDINEKEEKKKEKDNEKDTDNTCHKKDIFDINKIEGKKFDEKKDKKNNNAFIKQKRKNPDKMDNCLRIPTFVKESDKDNDNKSKNNNINEKKEDELISSSLKAKNDIIEEGQNFILFLNNKKFINMLKNIDNNNIRVNAQFLLNYQEVSISNFLTMANNEFGKFSELIVNLMKNKKDIFDLNDYSNELWDKDLNNSEKFKIKKNRCSLLINRIINQLSHFLLEYEFVVNVIKEIYEKNKNQQVLKDIINFIDKNKNILSKENFTHFEQLLRGELYKTEIYYMFNYVQKL